MSGIARDQQSAVVSVKSVLATADTDQIPVSIPGRRSDFIGELSRSFNPLQDECVLDFQVINVEGDRAFVLFEMPVGMTKIFATLLESLYGFFRLVDYRAKLKEMDLLLDDPSETGRIENDQKSFNQSVCAIYDALVARGIESKEAVKQTNRALKEQSHPWANHETVRSVLRASGRFAKHKNKKKS